MTPPKVSPIPDATVEPDAHIYPGGEGAPAYRWLFNLWIVLFLGVICLGLLNYLGIFYKSF